MKVDAALILGTGTGSLLEALDGEEIVVPTDEGPATIKLADFGGRLTALLPRHGKGHSLPPHLVPYKRNALALAQLKPTRVFASAAVGSLHADWAPGTCVVCTDVIDMTFRNLTLYEKSVRHCDMSDVMCRADSRLSLALQKLDIAFQRGVYLGTNGPRYETPSEIAAFQILGADIVGMTASTEAIIMKEASLAYECLAIVTNLAAGLNPSPLDHGEVGDVMVDAGPKALAIFAEAVRSLP